MKKLSEKKTEAINSKLEEAVVKNQMIIHIMPQEKQWIIKRGGTGRAYRIFNDIEDAIKEAKSLVEGQKELVLHKRDGSFEKLI